MKKAFLVFAVVIILTSAASLAMATTLAQWNFNPETYSEIPDTYVHARYAPVAGTLSSAFTEVRSTPKTGVTGPILAYSNWEQVTGASGLAGDTAINWYGNANAQHLLYTGTGTESTTFTNWFTASRQQLSISAKIKFNKFLVPTNSAYINQMFTIGIGQSGNLTQNLFHINASIYTQRYSGGGTNRGGVGDTHNLSNYTADTTFGNNAAVATNISNTGTVETVEANWRSSAGLTLQRNDIGYDPRMSKFAERGSIGDATPFVAADPNYIPIAVAGADGIAGNTDDWYDYRMDIDFSTGTIATYNVYVNNILQATLTQNLPTGKLATDYWTIRELKLGPYTYFSGAIDNVQISTVPEPATLVGLLAFAPALIAVARRKK